MRHNETRHNQHTMNLKTNSTSTRPPCQFLDQSCLYMLLTRRSQHHGNPTIWTRSTLEDVHSITGVVRVLDIKNKKYRTTGTHGVYPAQCVIPTISEVDETILAAAQLVRMVKENISNNVAVKEKHALIIQKSPLSWIMHQLRGWLLCHLREWGLHCSHQSTQQTSSRPTQ